MSDLRLNKLRLHPWYPGQMGVPGSDVPLGIHTAYGNVFYVGDPNLLGTTVATDNNDGTDPMNPKATIQSALDACTDGEGDIVVVMPGNYTLTATLTMTLDRVRLVSWDHLRGEPAPSVMVQGDGTFDLLAINADQIEVAGIRWANGDATTALDCITIGTTGAVVGCFIHDCRFAVGGGSGVEIGTASGTVNDCTVEDCTFIQIDDNATAAGVYIAYAVRAMVQKNFFWTDQAGTFGVRIRNAATNGSLVRDNDFVIVEAGGVAISRGASSTVSIHGNRVSGGPTSTSAISQVADGGIYAVENYVSDAGGGALIDATT